MKMKYGLQTKLTKEQKVQRKKYFKMLKKHRKAIMKQAKLAASDPFDALAGFDVFIEHMKLMLDYYELGYNVFAHERSEEHTRAKTLRQALKEYELGFDENNEALNLFYDYSQEFDITKDVKNNTIKFPLGYGKPLNNRTELEAAKAYSDFLLEHKTKFFEILRNEIDYWWD